MAGEVAARPARLISIHDRLLTLLACTLCVTAQLKIFEIQYLEIVYAFDLLLVLLWCSFRLPLHVFRPFLRIGAGWTVFSFLALALAAYSLRQDFYAPNPALLKQPFVVSLARLGEIILDLFALLYLAERFRVDAKLRRLGSFAFYAVGMASCAYGLLSEVLLALGVRPGGGVTWSYRMTGFNNEPGPFGAYLIPVIFVAAALWQQKWITRRHFLVSEAILFLCLLLSQSGSALLELITIGAIVVLLKLKPIRAVMTCAVVVLIGVVLFQALGLKERLDLYVQEGLLYPQVSALRPTDAYVVMCRISGLYLTPQMIAAHPLAGIGLGNYPIIRDDPQYRHGSPIVATPLDSPSLGLIDYVVDLGIPLTLFLTWIELAPAFPMRRLGASASLLALLLVLPVSTWFGAHLNFTYLWVAAAIGLGIFYGQSPASGPQGAVVPTSLEPYRAEHAVT